MKMIKKIIIMFIISLCITSICQVKIVYGKASLEKDVSGFEAEVTQKEVNSATGLKTIAARFLGFIRVISALALVLMLGTTGYQYIVATPEIKGDIQKRMLPVVLGIIFVFAASAIAGFILKGIGG